MNTNKEYINGLLIKIDGIARRVETSQDAELRWKVIHNMWSWTDKHQVFDDVTSLWNMDLASFEDAKVYARYKLTMLSLVKNFFRTRHEAFDEYNGLAPVINNLYHAYEFKTLFVWGVCVLLAGGNFNFANKTEKNKFFKVFGKVIGEVTKKYPTITASIVFEMNLKHPELQFDDYMKLDEANFEDEVQPWDDAEADKFKNWLLEWTNAAMPKDRMRVEAWFDTDKSHKQIFAEINKVVGNTGKFNSRLACFVERLCTNDNLNNFFAKSGFATKEEMFLAYFEKLTNFNSETKKSFIRKYLVKD